MLLLQAFVVTEAVRALSTSMILRNHASIRPSAVAAAAELLKLAVALVVRYRTLDRRASVWSSLSLEPRQTFQYSVPAVCYLFNTLAYFWALQKADPAMVHVLMLSKFPLTAIIHHLAVKSVARLKTWGALATLTLGLVLFSLSNLSAHISNSSTILLAIIASLTIALVSSLTSVYTEILLKDASDFWCAQVYLYGFGFALAFPLSLLWSGRASLSASIPAVETITFGWATLLTVVTAGAGLLVALILKARDNIVKLIGNALTIIVVLVGQSLLQHKVPPPASIISAGLVLLSVWVYNDCLLEEASRKGTYTTDLSEMPLSCQDDSLDVAGSDMSDEARDGTLQIRPSLSIIFTCALAILLLATLSHLSRSGGLYPKDSILPALPKPTQSHVINEQDVLRFADKETQTYILVHRGERFCQLRNICFSDASPSIKGDPMRLWLSSNITRSDEAHQALKEALEVCFYNFRGHGFAIGILPAEIEQERIVGTTFMVWAHEGGNHPASWGHLWATLSSDLAWHWHLLMKADEIEARPSRRPQHIQVNLTSNASFLTIKLLNEVYALNGWEEFYMNTALHAIQAASPWGRYGVYFGHKAGYEAVDGDKDLTSPSFSQAEKLYTTLDAPSVKCFDHTVTSRTHRYWKERAEAELFRRTAFAELGFDQSRPHPCRLQDFKVVVLTRNRPLWNLDVLLAILRDEFNIESIDITSFSANTPYFEQATTFYYADLVLSVHGSQLANTVYMRDGSHLIEVIPHKYSFPDASLISSYFGFQHFSLTNNSLPPSDLVAAKDPSFLPRLEKCQALSKEFLTTGQCMGDPGGCGGTQRALGAFANVEDFRSAVNNIKASALLDGFCQST